MHPAYNSILITFSLSLISPFEIIEELNNCLIRMNEIELPKTRMIEIKVCYHKEFGIDLDFVARHNNITADEVIKYHIANNYLVYFLGFSPGFPYLGDMPANIAAPRLQTPRIKVPCGSVAIGGNQTGIYPIESPGGWRIIGRTPLKLFSYENENPSLLQMGDIVKFIPITKNEFEKLA